MFVPTCVCSLCRAGQSLPKSGVSLFRCGSSSPHRQLLWCSVNGRFCTSRGAETTPFTLSWMCLFLWGRGGGVVQRMVCRGIGFPIGQASLHVLGCFLAVLEGDGGDWIPAGCLRDQLRLPLHAGQLLRTRRFQVGVELCPSSCGRGLCLFGQVPSWESERVTCWVDAGSVTTREV